jgi:hypothetical protein
MEGKMQLAKSAMLVSVSIINGGLLGERRDNTASLLVENTYNTAHHRTKASKYLIDRKHKSVKQVVAASQRVREVAYRYSMPWGDDKSRLLPVKTADEFRSKVAIALAERQEAIEQYILDYPALVSASERDLGELFDRSQYPTLNQVRDLFTAKVAYWPIPESNNFIADISEAASKEAKESIENEIEQRLLEATYDMVRRAKEVVVAFVDKLENFKVDENGKSQTIFRDSIVDNIRDTAQLIERMNLTDNPQIKKVVLDLKRLVHQTSIRGIRDTGYGDAYRARALTAGQEVLVNLTMLDLKDQEVTEMVADASDYMEF